MQRTSDITRARRASRWTLLQRAAEGRRDRHLESMTSYQYPTPSKDAYLLRESCQISTTKPYTLLKNVAPKTTRRRRIRR